MKDSDGLDLGCHLVSKEYMLEAYPELVPWMKAPGLWLWGSNDVGRLGDNSVVSESSPVQTISAGTNWKQVSASLGNVSTIKTDGTLWLWGYGPVGRLGNNSTISVSSPVQTISGGTNWKQVSGGAAHAAAIKTDGTLWLWGCETTGRLGANVIISRSSPIQTISGGTNWCRVSAGGFHTIATKNDGTLWTFGYNAFGQIGSGTTANASSPVQTISGGTNWRHISTGLSTSAAVKDDGTLWLWGFGGGGRLGTDSTLAQSSPVQTVSGGTNWKQVSLGCHHSAAIKTDGTLWLWGCGACGRLGSNSEASVSSPVQTISGGTNWKQVSVGRGHSGAIKTDGTLWLWGCGGYGVLGTNSLVSVSSPVQTISGGTGWRQASLHYVVTVAIRDQEEY